MSNIKATATASKAKTTAKEAPTAINISKGQSVPLDVINSQLNRIRGKAGNVKKDAVKMGKESLLSSVTELTGDSALLMDERAISPLLKEGVIGKDDATAFRAYARLAKALQTIANL